MALVGWSLTRPSRKSVIMSRIPTPAAESATGATAELFAQIKKAAGNTIMPDLTARSGNRRGLRDFLAKGRSVLSLGSHEALAAGHTAATLALAAGLLLAAPVARADDGSAHGQQTVEGAGTDRVRVQPTARQFAPPNQPDVSAREARDIDALYHQLIGPKPATSPDSRSSTSTFSRAKR